MGCVAQSDLTYRVAPGCFLSHNVGATMFKATYDIDFIDALQSLQKGLRTEICGLIIKHYLKCAYIKFR